MSIYKKYCRERFDTNGNLVSFEFDYPESFNFGYDVVDEIASVDCDFRDKPYEAQIMETVTLD